MLNTCAYLATEHLAPGRYTVYQLRADVKTSNTTLNKNLVFYSKGAFTLSFSPFR